MTSSQEIRKSARVKRTRPKKLGSPQKKATKTRDPCSKSSGDYDVIVRALCKCQDPHLALCHFKHFSSEKDEWLSLQRLSPGAINAIPNVPCSASLPCPHRLKVGKGSGLSVHSGSVAAQDPASPGVIDAECPLAMQFLSTIVIPPISPHKRVVPPVPVFSPPSQLQFPLPPVLHRNISPQFDQLCLLIQQSQSPSTMWVHRHPKIYFTLFPISLSTSLFCLKISMPQCHTRLGQISGLPQALQSGDPSEMMLLPVSTPQ